MDWSLILAVLGAVATLALGVLAVYLKNDRDAEKTKTALAHMLGDALAEAVAEAKKQMSDVTDAQLDNIAGGVYDMWLGILPAQIRLLLLSVYPKPAFCEMFRKEWRAFASRQIAIRVAVARQVR